MAFDGTVIACMVKELKERTEGGRITKIAQPEPDELLLTLKKDRDATRLLISANASLPLIYFTDKNKTSPMTAAFASRSIFFMPSRIRSGSGSTSTAG